MPRERGQLERRAFTLVELVLVVLLLGIMASVAAPKYGAATANYRVDCAARRIAADLRLARDYAQRVSQAETVDFNAATDSYAFTNMLDVDHPGVVYAVALSGTQYAVDVTSVNFEGVDVIVFDMYGRPNRVGSVVVQYGSKQRTIQVDKVGNVSIL